MLKSRFSRLCVFALLFTAGFASMARAEEPAGPHALTFEEALSLALKNNRDIQAAKERLRGAHADVERALAVLLPTLNFQGKLTINEPEVSLKLDQSPAVFGAALQSAQIAD